MLKVEKTVLIEKPLAEVFTFTTNNENDTKWQSDVASIQMGEGPQNVVGSQYTEVRKFLGKDMKTVLEITAFEENKKWAAKVVKGPVPYEVTVTFHEDPQGTKVTIITEGETKGFFKLAENLVASALDKNLEESLNKLKILLESA